MWRSKMRKYLLLSTLFLLNFCSNVNEKEIFDKAQNDLNDKKYSEAVEIFNQLLNESPNSEFAPQAIFECAKIYHTEKVPNISKEESLNKAVQYYQRLYEDYPDYKESESAMMMTGFILSNELNKPEEAKVIYEEFLKKYPDSKLTGSVKLELESIGLSPDQMFSKLSKGKKK